MNPTTITATTVGAVLAAPLAVSIPEARRLTGFGRSTLHRLIDAGRLARVKVRGRTLIPYESLRTLVAADAQAQPAAR